MKKCLLGVCAALFFAGASLLLPLSPAPVAYASSGGSQTVGSDGLTDYEREQQNLPLSQRDKLIAEPKLLLAAVVLLTWFVWKMRRDIRKIKADNELYDRQRKEAERMLAELEEAEEAEEDEAEGVEGEAAGVSAEDEAGEASAPGEDGEAVEPEPIHDGDGETDEKENG